MQSYFDPFFQVGKVARRHGNTQEMISPFIEMKCKKLEQKISRSQNFDSVFLVPVSVCFFLMRYRNILKKTANKVTRQNIFDTASLLHTVTLFFKSIAKTIHPPLILNPLKPN